MDEDAGVRAPVTRLRRRLSVEQSEESKSPAVNTPTKKRGGRKGKPDLDLIDENTPDNTPNIKTKKPTVIESVEDKVTPSRRNTRIKSNTSVISDIVTNINSPRAKRAARRASQAGSDSEAPLTPLKQTRKTRKDSTSSVETVETQQSTKSALAINDVIIEEPENHEPKSINNLEKVDNTSPSSLRKSPRLANKKTSQNDSKQLTEVTKEDVDITSSSKKTKKSVDSSPSKTQDTEKTDNNERNKLSESSSILLRELSVTVPKCNLENLNKSAIVVQNNDKTRRKRTKSWTTLTDSNESKFNSDNESTKKKVEHSENNNIPLNKSGSGDASMTLFNKSDKSICNQKKKYGNNDEYSMSKSQNQLEKQDDSDNDIAHPNSEKNNITELFRKDPSHKLQTRIYIEEDLDSNVEKNKQNNQENEDQCVPVAKHPALPETNNDNLNTENDQTNKSNLFINQSKQKLPMNDTCEPMDVDETIPDNLLLDDSSSTKRKSIANSSKLKMIVSEDELNNTKRKTSMSQNLEKSGNENKSTLILSQLKDTSNDVNIDTKSPAQVKSDKNLSRTTDILNMTQENEVNRKNNETIPDNLLLDDSSSTKRKSIANSSKLKIIVSEDELNNTKRKTSISQNLEKSGNENKSTLILSQLKDTSNDVNIDTKSPAQVKSDKNLSRTTDILNMTQENEVNRKNISLNCVTTSTPLQQKNLQKLALQVNSSLILANDNSKDLIEHLNQTKNTDQANEDDEKDSSGEKSSIEVEKNADQKCNSINDKSFSGKNSENDNVSKNNSTKLKQRVSDEELESDNDSLNIKRKINNRTPKKNISVTTNESIDEMESDGESQENNSLVDNEADDAGDDYESGDSQDESEREYNRQNQVVDKGETLTSEEDLSDDSDYEKDSFIVSSDEEDNDLLNGSGDDLSMTDNELKMTTKSKEKFNERKKKEQKTASKEMYESRHKINAKTKKNRHKKISSSESEEESIVKPRNANKMRLDSTGEESMLELKETKRKSVCEESVLNEKELTIANESLKENDPLLNEIKSEPKTPQKGNSSIAFVNSDDLNKSELTKTQTEIDPLNDSSDDGSLTSEDDDLMQNYDSILESLNKSNKVNAKTCDISLNLDKKAKKQKAAVIDELNLTQVRSSKKNESKLVKETVISSKIENQDESSSDSIDLRLLFSEESNDSEEVRNRKNAEIVEEQFIPLKRTDAKTDITGENDEMEENYVNFFIDTEGSHASNNKSLDTSLKNKRKTFVLNDARYKSLDSKVSLQKDVSSKKLEYDRDETDFPINKSLNRSTAKTPVGANKESNVEMEIQEYNSDSDAPVEVSYQNESSKVKDMRITPGVKETESPMESYLNKSVSSAKKKKNKQKHELSALETENLMESSFNMSVSSAKKKKNKNFNESIAIETENPMESSLNMSVSSAKKKKNKNKNESMALEPENPLESSLSVSLGSAKKNRNRGVNETSAIETVTMLDSSVNKSISSAKKKKNKVITEATVTETVNSMETSLNVSLNSAKKKNKNINESTTTDDVAAMGLNLSASSSKKKKTSVSKLPHSEELMIYTEEGLINTSINKIPGSHKKETSMRQTEESAALSQINESNLKRRKRKSSHNISIENTEDKDGDANNSEENDAVTGSQKKKQKISPQNDGILAIEKGEALIVQNSGKGNKTKMLSKNNKQEEISRETTKRRKRKQREDEDDNDRVKVFNENSFDKHVPRLPSSILNQLEENPHKINAAKKAKVLSTTRFLVEETKKRKSKPSNYLEESIYLNDPHTPDRTQKKHLVKAKVLPFVPTAVTSGAGCTSNFKITVLPKEIKFVAQSTNVNNFKQETLYFNKKIKRQGTYEMYKKNRNVKMSKF